MIHNTLKTPQPSETSHRRTNSAAQRKLWRYSGCRGSNQEESHRRSVCVLTADLNGEEGGGRGGSGVMHTIHGLCHLCIGCRLPQVTILRGKDGYGFTICSDSPVRVQAVDPGGPADQAGLQQLDTLLQLNGQPVEQWKCVDLAHAIRNSANEITVVVWRTGPSAKPSFEGLIHRPSYKPSTSNYQAPSPPTRRRTPDVGPSKPPPAVPPLPAHHRPTTARRLLVNGSETGNSVGGSRGTLAWGAHMGSAEELDGKPRLLHHPPTATLKGTRVKASNGDNYIILAPINPGSQVPQTGGGLHLYHLLRPPHPHYGHLVAQPRYVSLPYIPGADR